MHQPKVSIVQAARRFASRLATLQVIWIAIDLAAAIPAFYVALLLRFGGNLAEAELNVGAIAPRALMFAALIVAGLLVTGMYRTRQRVRPVQIISHAAVSVVIGGMLNILIYYAYPPLSTGRGVLLLAMFIAFTLIALIRRGFADAGDRLVRRRRIVVIGAGMAAQKIARRRRQADRRRYNVIAYLGTPGDISPSHGLALEPRLENFEDLYNLEFDEIVLALDDRRGAVPVEVLFNFRQNGVNVLHLVDFLEREAGQVDIDIADSAWFIFTEGCHMRPLYLAAKRAVDIVGSIALLITLSPALVLVSAALFMEGMGRDPVLYRQERVGLRGKPFQLLKFRSMRTDAETNGPAWAAEDDDRITFVGRIIRRLRMDELPQLVNILKGEMSIVGPRPERPGFVDELAQQIPMYRYRHLVKPGLAGWAQLSFPYGASVDDARQKLKYDLYYIKNATCLLDLFILAHTFEVVIWGRSVSMAGRSSDDHPVLPSSKLLKWQPRTSHADTATRGL